MIRKMTKSKAFYPALGLIIAAVGVPWGQGILLRPKISISCGAINYNIPAQYIMEGSFRAVLQFFNIRLSDPPLVPLVSPVNHHPSMF